MTILHVVRAGNVFWLVAFVTWIGVLIEAARIDALVQKDVRDDPTPPSNALWD